MARKRPPAVPSNRSPPQARQARITLNCASTTPGAAVWSGRDRPPKARGAVSILDRPPSVLGPRQNPNADKSPLETGPRQIPDAPFFRGHQKAR